VYVVYGSAAGLGESQTSPLVLHQDVAGVGGVAATGDRFGEALAAADVNGDGWDDLAVGVPGEDILFGNEGALQVFLSSVGGVVAAADTYIVPNDFYGGTYGLHGSAAFGSALAACDLDGDGWEDLLVGAPDWRDNEPFSEDDLGYVLLLPGSPSGTRVDWAESFTTWEQDRFGAAVDCRRAESTGEFHVLVGAPRSSDFPGSEPGAVFALLDGEFVDSDQGEQAEARYGERVAWGDFAGLGEPQSIAGAPGWDFPGPIGEGGLVLVRELGGTLSTSFSQDSSGIADHVEGFDHFGAALAVADFNRDGYDDAVISAPDENLNDGPETKFDVGVVHVLFGGSGGLSGSAAQYWHWDSIGFGALAYDQFGAALAVGDFDGNGVDDLAIGAPGAEWSGQADTGIVEILYAWPDGWIFGDDFEGGNTQKWSL
jgi:hypothetical protein